MPGYSGNIVTPTSSQSNCSAFNMPADLHCNDVTDMRAPVLDVLVPTPTMLHTQFNMPVCLIDFKYSILRSLNYYSLRGI